jgi:gluconate 2-dehydrogenase gamma chain
MAAAAYARASAASPTPPELKFFTQEQATEIDAITSRIIPSDDSPGAHEAGIVYLIDAALVSFAVDDQKEFQAGLPALQVHVAEMFPGVKKFSDATPQQQDEVLHSLDQPQPGRRGAFRANPAGQNFFETLLQYTIGAFLLDPDTRGDHQGLGWKLIGREREHMFQPPFGYYDKDYPGWQPNAEEAEKK